MTTIALPSGPLFARCLPPQVPDGATARAAVAAMVDFDHGSRTGAWDPFLGRLAEDATLIVPAPGFAEKGLMKGRDRAAEIFAYHDGVAGLTWSVRTFTACGPEHVFEAVVTNEGGEGPAISLMLLLIFVMDGARIVQLREYAIHTGEDGAGWGGDGTTRAVFAYRGNPGSEVE